MVIYGDMNTKYFYGVTTIRRRKNRYGMIKDEEGNWVTDLNMIEGMVTKFYRRFYNVEEVYQLFVMSHVFSDLGEMLEMT